MALETITPLLLIIVLTLISGIGDAQGFIHAARLWQGGSIAWSELTKSALGFGVGISMYWLALRSMKELGILAPEIQTVIWFGVTLVGVALASGSFFKWQLIDQAVAVGVLAGIGWLMLRTLA